MPSLAPTLAFGLVVTLAGPAAAAPDPQPALNAAIGAVLQADGPRAITALKAVDPSALTASQAALRTCALSRLTESPAPPPADMTDPFARAVLTAYRAYWRDAVSGAERRAPAEATLLATLRTLLDRPDLKDMDAAEPLLSARLLKSGYHALEGQTGLLRELMLWSGQEARDYTVALPEGGRTTRVFLLNGFASMGWSSYFTCDQVGTGGWTKPEGLYAVVPKYKSLDDEAFRVSFLGHESQHFADNARFPDLKAWEKEYRAKLVELAEADATLQRLLGKFTLNQSDDPNEPHSYADKRVLTALRLRLGLAADADLAAVPGDRLRAAAKAELQADSARRSAA